MVFNSDLASIEYYCKQLIIGGYSILATLAVKARSAKIIVCQYLIFNTLTYA